MPIAAFELEGDRTEQTRTACCSGDGFGICENCLRPDARVIQAMLHVEEDYSVTIHCVCDECFRSSNDPARCDECGRVNDAIFRVDCTHEAPLLEGIMQALLVNPVAAVPAGPAEQIGEAPMVLPQSNETITLTFAEVTEQGPGMEKIGAIAVRGFSHEDLEQARAWFTARDVECELIDLRDQLPLHRRQEAEGAWLFIARGGTNSIVRADKLFTEIRPLEWDKKSIMRGKVKNKRARHNLVFADYDQEPDYEGRKGRIVDFAHLPYLRRIRETLPTIIGPAASNLFAEGNHYYEAKSGIGYHGDAERRKVVGFRLGGSIPIAFQWYHRSMPVGERLVRRLNDGDMYIMSHKAAGTDWKFSSKLTLRHAAGSELYINPRALQKKLDAAKRKHEDVEDDEDDESEESKN
jgi:hypothetical protein